MVVALYLVAFAMVLGGGGALVRGAPFLNMDWGSTLVLAGTIAASCGALLAGFAAAAARLQRLEREVVLAREQVASAWLAAPAPFADPVFGAASAAGAGPPHVPEPRPGFPGAPGVEARYGEMWAAPDLGPPAEVRLAGAALVSGPPPGIAHAAQDPDAVRAADPPGRERAGDPGTGPAGPDLLAQPRRELSISERLAALREAAPARPARVGPRPEVVEPSVPRAEPAPSAGDGDAPTPLPAEPGPAPGPAAARAIPDPDVGPGLAIPLVPEVVHADRETPPESAAAPASATEPSETAPTPPGPGEPPVEIGRYASGGNSYVMFSDGTIEAETPTGHYRFTSLDQLKEFIASGGEKPASAML